MSTAAHPNWVAELAKCNVKKLFNSLYSLIQIDVKRMKAEQPAPGFSITETENNLGIEWTAGGRSHLCTLVYHPASQSIDVTVDNERTHTIATRWDPKRARCYVVLSPMATGDEDPPLEFRHKHLWKVVQHVLAPLFFPDKIPTCTTQGERPLTPHN